MHPAFEATPPAAELAVEQGAALKKEVEQHTAKFSRAVSSAVENTHQLLNLLREATPSAKEVDHLWQELEQIFEATKEARTALPEFMEKQRDNMSLYHSSMMNETIRETQQEVNLQHKKINTQHNLILEQQDAFQNYKAQVASKFKELENLQERVSRLTLEKGNLRTEVHRYKELLEQEYARKIEYLKTTGALQKELETLVASKKQAQAANEILRNTTTDMLEQLKTTEQRVTDRFTNELKAKAEQLQKETVKTRSLDTLVNTLKDTGGTIKKELEKIKNENRLLNVKYSNQTSEYATAFTKMNEQNKKIEVLATDIDRLQKQNADLQAKLEKAAELGNTNIELQKASEDLVKRLDSIAAELKNSKDDAKAAQNEAQLLKTKLATEAAIPTASNDKASQEKYQALEKKNRSTEAALAEWTELAKRSYKEYKDMLPTYREAEKYKQDAHDKEMQITDLKHQLAAANISQSNGVGAAGGDSAYWKQKYENLLTGI
ncbi:uncharacterized protein M421DRAFT_421507 [Didymella exigua CBS 183.55]|uniref:Uncharacterized protein n=1 Tax=Didymella exigua CBS 183.55 TaxID=1150837 RepID=A0A6A5RL10_9PLEO|nr:uncharacterized protein M421DRAFT_421507 [Didymella exigua CBS 183.55]KAF1927664.1 hypothetical protein M421DRAFT_421507 [Didymella exigua CBS 183.55]